MRHALFLTTSLPPFPESQSIRNAFLLRGLFANGWSITVVTTPVTRGDKSLEALLPPLRVLRTELPSYDRFVERLAKLPFGRRLTWIFGVLASLFCIPDTRYGWHQLAAQKVRASIEEIGAVDLIIAASGSCTAHVAAAELAARLDVPYLAELGDPWTYNPIWPANAIWKRISNRSLEMKSVGVARAVTVTTDETARVYKSRIVPGDNRVEVLTMGYASAEFADTSPAGGSGEYLITYIGVAYRSARNVMPLLEAVQGHSGLASAKVEIVGAHSASFVASAQQKGMGFVTFVGPVPYDESLTRMKKADLLVIIGNKATLQIPGKVFMYLASGRPILLLSQNDPAIDPTWQVLKKFSGTHVATFDVQSIRSVLNYLAQNRERVAAEAYSRLRDPHLVDFEWREIGERFAALANDCVATRGASK